MSRLEELCTAYEEYVTAPSGATEKGRAEREAEIWALVSVDERKSVGTKGGRGSWLQRRFGGPCDAYEFRCVLLGAGEPAAPLWVRVEGDMTLRTAAELLREARKAAVGPGVNLGEEVARVLARYDDRPHVAPLPGGGGKVIRKKGPLFPARDERVSRARRRVVIGPKTFWVELRQTVAVWVAERLVGVEESVADEIYRALETDLRVLSDEYQSKIDLARRRGTRLGRAGVGRREVVEACAVLSLDPPAPGEPVDLVIARRHQRRQARLYHPDARGGSEETREAYERVIQAYQTLERYAAERGRALPHLRVVSGGQEGDEHGGRTRED